MFHFYVLHRLNAFIIIFDQMFSFNSSFFISRLRFVISPPIRPLSFEVRHFQPPFITLSPSPSSSAISNFSFSSGSQVMPDQIFHFSCPFFLCHRSCLLCSSRFNRSIPLPGAPIHQRLIFASLFFFCRHPISCKKSGQARLSSP